MYFNLIANKILNKIGGKTINRGRTLLLSCNAKGDIMVIFKRKNEPKLKVPSGFLVTANEKGWMSKVLMTRYIKEIWMKQVGHQSLLMMDSFCGHLTNLVKSSLRKHKVMPVIIPGRCTSKLQSLDISFNNPFKQSLRKWAPGFMKYKRLHIKTSNSPTHQDWGWI